MILLVTCTRSPSQYVEIAAVLNQEIHELRNIGLAEYVTSTQNMFDLMSFFNVLSLGVMLVVGSELARSAGAMGTVLLIPKVI